MGTVHRSALDDLSDRRERARPEPVRTGPTQLGSSRDHPHSPERWGTGPLRQDSPGSRTTTDLPRQPDGLKAPCRGDWQGSAKYGWLPLRSPGIRWSRGNSTDDLLVVRIIASVAGPTLERSGDKSRGPGELVAHGAGTGPPPSGDQDQGEQPAEHERMQGGPSHDHGQVDRSRSLLKGARRSARLSTHLLGAETPNSAINARGVAIYL